MNHASIPYLEILSFSWLLSAPSRCTLIVTNEGARLCHVSSTQLLVPPANIYRQAVWILSCNWDALGAKWGSDGWDGGRGRGVVMVMRWLPRKYRKETICDSKALQQRNNKKVGGGNIRDRGEAPEFCARSCYHYCDGWGLTLNNKSCRNGTVSRLGTETLSKEKYGGENPISASLAQFLWKKGASRCFQQEDWPFTEEQHDHRGGKALCQQRFSSYSPELLRYPHCQRERGYYQAC